MNSIPSTQANHQEQEAHLKAEGYRQKRHNKQDFTLIQNEILRDPALSKGAKLALIMLLSYCWFDKNNCFPGQERLAQDLHKSVRTVRRYLTELKEKAYIKTIHRGLGKTNLYTITLPACQTGRPANGTKPTAAEQSTMACPDRTKMAGKFDETKFTEVESNEDPSNTLKGMDESTETCSHKAHSTIRKPEERTIELSHTSHRNTDTTPHTHPSSPNRSGVSKPETLRSRETGRQPLSLSRNDEVKREQERPTLKPMTQDEINALRMQGKNASGQTPLQTILDEMIPREHQQTLTHQLGKMESASQLRCKPMPVYPKLQSAIEEISERLGDFHHVKSNITHADNIRRETNVSIEQLLDVLGEAYHATRIAAQKGSITKQDEAGRPVSMPYFFSCLRQKVGLPPKEGQTV